HRAADAAVVPEARAAPPRRRDALLVPMSQYVRAPGGPAGVRSDERARRRLAGQRRPTGSGRRRDGVHGLQPLPLRRVLRTAAGIAVVESAAARGLRAGRGSDREADAAEQAGSAGRRRRTWRVTPRRN